MTVQNGYVKARVAMWGIALTVGILGTIFTVVFAKTNGLENKVADTREEVASVSATTEGLTDWLTRVESKLDKALAK